MKLRGILLSSTVALLLGGCGGASLSATTIVVKKSDTCADLGKPDAKHPYAMPYGNPWTCEVRP